MTTYQFVLTLKGVLLTRGKVPDHIIVDTVRDLVDGFDRSMADAAEADLEDSCADNETAYEIFRQQ